MRSNSYLGLGPHGFHRLAYVEWGAPPREHVLLCVHGLTRNGRDFDFLARALAETYRVVCPDVAGRGKSAWLAKASDYGYPQYLADMTALIARLEVDAVDMVGTSMGGIIGMMLAAQPGLPVRRLVVNDVGPFIPKMALERIAAYVGQDRTFVDLEAVEAHLRDVHAPFGPLTDEQWQYLAWHSARPRDGGGFGLAYDPAIGDAFKGDEPIDDVDLWSVWDAIRCPVLVLRGAESDHLPAETAAEMRERGPRAEVVEIAGVGHAPALMADDQIALVRDWLARTSHHG